MDEKLRKRSRTSEKLITYVKIDLVMIYAMLLMLQKLIKN